MYFPAFWWSCTSFQSPDTAWRSPPPPPEPAGQPVPDPGRPTSAPWNTCAPCSGYNAPTAALGRPRPSAFRSKALLCPLLHLPSFDGWLTAIMLPLIPRFPNPGTSGNRGGSLPARLLLRDTIAPGHLLYRGPRPPAGPGVAYACRTVIVLYFWKVRGLKRTEPAGFYIPRALFVCLLFPGLQTGRPAPRAAVEDDEVGGGVGSVPDGRHHQLRVEAGILGPSTVQGDGLLLLHGGPGDRGE